MNIKMELVFKDRIGIVADISAVIADHGINIVSMEVEQKEDRAHVFLEARKRDQTVDDERLLAILSDIPDLIRLQYIDIMPQKERENRFRVVLDNISDGVFSIDILVQHSHFVRYDLAIGSMRRCPYISTMRQDVHGSIHTH